MGPESPSVQSIQSELLIDRTYQEPGALAGFPPVFVSFAFRANP